MPRKSEKPTPTPVTHHARPVLAGAEAVSCGADMRRARPKGKRKPKPLVRDTALDAVTCHNCKRTHHFRDLVAHRATGALDLTTGQPEEPTP